MDFELRWPGPAKPSLPSAETGSSAGGANRPAARRAEPKPSSTVVDDTTDKHNFKITTRFLTLWAPPGHVQVRARGRSFKASHCGVTPPLAAADQHTPRHGDGVAAGSRRSGVPAGPAGP